MKYARWGIPIALIAGVIYGAQRFDGVPVTEVVGTLLVGWWRFLARVVPQQHINWSGVATAVICLLLLAVGAHRFVSWFYTAWQSTGDESPRQGSWRFRWTAYLLGLVVLTFAAGTAFVGVVHQVIWLARSPSPKTIMAPSLGGYTYTPNQLKYIGLGLHSYSRTFGDLPRVADGRHSWISPMLPYMVISNREYDFSKPWNDPANKSICQRPIIDFLKGDVREDIRNKDGYAVSHFAGNVHVFARGGDTKVRMEDLPGSTLLVGEAAGNFRAWADPENLRNPLIGIATSPDGFGNTSGSGAYFVEASGTVRFINRDIAPEVLQAISWLRQEAKSSE
ncbi:MAG: hypothetical protein SGJ19_01640 [Planctomycetia bacterium]|nr:hypothetical protein [Planctomycetia bacterium]